MVCEKSALFASAVAVAKAFPLYSRKTSGGKGSSTDVNGKRETRVVNVEFLIVSRVEGEFKVEEGGLSKEEIGCIEDAAKAVRNAARLVDTPANELHTDAFVEVGESDEVEA